MIAERYELVEQIGTGGMATVWKAKDTLLGRSVAIKRLLPHLATNPEAAERFTREAQAAAGLSHPGIVTVFDTGEDDGGPYIVLELIEGTTLAARLVENGPVDPAAVADIVTQVASALDHAHAMGVVHRDVKPANMILEPEGRVRLTDFGIAKTFDDPTTVTTTGELVGTISYMAPEILQGHPATPSSDLYSLGAVTYELLAGRPPFAAETPAALLEAVRVAKPPSLKGLAPDVMASAVSVAMAKDPTQRMASAGAFASSLVGTITQPMEAADQPMASAAGSGSFGGSEDPTLVIDPPPGPPEPVQAGTVPAQRNLWPVLVVLLGLVAVAAIAMSDERDPAAEDATAAGNTIPAVSPTTSTTPLTTTAPSTTTTTTTTTTTIVEDSPEGVAAAIGALLNGLEAPQFKPKDVREVDERLDRVMEAWENSDDEKLRQELERAFEAVNDLDDSAERDELTELFIHLAELMGFDVQQAEQDDD
jgi:serine/threonine protein kinase